ncbi:unnamed protein product [Microthlaspi erraticum]|uniref:Uncharacterized protein n=1 Tax=Microthlaspi erraticum TaxID=1685480 RepID=A0A6D2J9A3_9BRAS|nr:unnamed protein product [Microthlaspi erraticum]
MDKEQEGQHEPEEGKLVAEEQLEAEEALAGPMGLMTRSRTKLLNQAIGLILRHLGQDKNEVIPTTLVVRFFYKSLFKPFNHLSHSIIRALTSQIYPSLNLKSAGFRRISSRTNVAFFAGQSWDDSSSVCRYARSGRIHNVVAVSAV